MSEKRSRGGGLVEGQPIDGLLVEPNAELVELELVVVRDLPPVPPLVVQLKLLDPLVDLADIVLEPHALQLDNEQLGHLLPDAGLLPEDQVLVLLARFVVFGDQRRVPEGEVERVVGVHVDVGLLEDELVQQKAVEEPDLLALEQQALPLELAQLHLPILDVLALQEGRELAVLRAQEELGLVVDLLGEEVGQRAGGQQQHELVVQVQQRLLEERGERQHEVRLLLHLSPVELRLHHRGHLPLVEEALDALAEPARVHLERGDDGQLLDHLVAQPVDPLLHVACGPFGLLGGGLALGEGCHVAAGEQAVAVLVDLLPSHWR